MAATAIATNVALAASGVSLPYVLNLPDMVQGAAISLLTAYPATAGTTGATLKVSYSIDGGVSYSDYGAAVLTTAPQASQASSRSSQKVVQLLGVDQYCTNMQFIVTNLDATNACTFTLQAATTAPGL